MEALILRLAIGRHAVYSLRIVLLLCQLDCPGNVPEAPGVQIRHLEIGNAELVGVLQIIGIEGDSPSVEVAGGGEILSLERGETCTAMKNHTHLVFQLFKIGFGQLFTVLPFGQDANPSLCQYAQVWGLRTFRAAVELRTSEGNPDSQRTNVIFI